MVEAFPKPNDDEIVAWLVNEHIRTELEKAGIAFQQLSLDTQNNTFIITTDKNVPKIQSNITQYAESKGFTVKFITSV